MKFILLHPIRKRSHILSVSENGRKNENLIQLAKPKRNLMISGTNMLVKSTKVRWNVINVAKYVILLVSALSLIR